MRSLRADLVLDVGAGTGQFASQLRGNGYRGRIASFEPLAESFRALEERSSRDPLWDTFNVAVGAAKAEGQIFVAGNASSSSLLPMLPLHVANAPASAHVAMQSVRIERLDDMAADLLAHAKAPYLKIDVQGYELEVLKGAPRVLEQVVAVQAELSLLPLYQGAPTFLDFVSNLREIGFVLVGIEPGFTAADGRLLQADGIFASGRTAWVAREGIAASSPRPSETL